MKKKYDQIDHLLKSLASEKAELQGKINKIEKLESELRDNKDFEFKCPHPDQGGMCLDCSELGPEIVECYGESGKYYEKHFPNKVTDSAWELALNRFNSGDLKGCTEWAKKQHEGACGCAGEVWCDCGYWTTVCTPFQVNVCKFCGRELHYESGGSATSIMFKTLNLDIFGKIGKIDEIK